MKLVALSVTTFTRRYNFLFYYFFHLCNYSLPRRIALVVLYLRQAVTPTRFRRCQDIAVQVKLFLFLFFSFLNKYD